MVTIRLQVPLQSLLMYFFQISRNFTPPSLIFVYYTIHKLKMHRSSLFNPFFHKIYVFLVLLGFHFFEMLSNLWSLLSRGAPYILKSEKLKMNLEYSSFLVFHILGCISVVFAQIKNGRYILVYLPLE